MNELTGKKEDKEEKKKDKETTTDNKTEQNSKEEKKSSGPYVPPVYSIKTDKDGYIESFSLDQSDLIKQFFNEYGFVVVNKILNESECKNTIDEIWSFVTEKVQSVDRKDPMSWDKGWSSTGIENEGIIGYNPIWKPMAIQNRQNPNIYQVCKILLGEDKLLMNHDRYGLFRPTVDVPINNEKKSFPQWKTMHNLHFDMNPWRFIEESTAERSDKVLASLRYKNLQDFIVENNEIGVMSENKVHIQGLINLADNLEDDGGFIIVPGFKHHFVDWIKSRKILRDIRRFPTQSTFIVIPSSDPIYERGIRVTCRAGSIVIWDQRTCHGSRPNNSSHSRYAQFFRMSRAAPFDSERMKARAVVVSKFLKDSGVKESELTTLGAKLFGLKPWANGGQ